MLDQHIKRINISGDENPIDIKFGSQYDRQCFMISDSYLDKMSFKSLNELIAEREKVIYKSAEWSKIQNLINQLLNSSVRHDDGIVSLPLHNIPINVSIGSDFDSNIYSDKSGNLCVDFPKYVYGETPILNISFQPNAVDAFGPFFPSKEFNKSREIFVFT